MDIHVLRIETHGHGHFLMLKYSKKVVAQRFHKNNVFKAERRLVVVTVGLSCWCGIQLGSWETNKYNVKR